MSLIITAVEVAVIEYDFLVHSEKDLSTKIRVNNLA